MASKPSRSADSRVKHIARDLQAQHLQNFYGYSGLHEEQQVAVDAVLGGLDVLVTAPTGFGKSLCFVIPALVRFAPKPVSEDEAPQALTIVVTPLLALMADQVSALRKRGISAAVLSSSQSRKDNEAVETAISGDGKLPYALVYVTAERVTASFFLNVLRTLYTKKRLAMFAIDEAHCISQWGHDFRKSYAQLGVLKQNFPSVPVMALTATATPRVASSILESLRLPDPVRVHKSFLRSNIKYRVEYADGSLCHSSVEEHIVEYVLKRLNDTGIVYVHKRVTVDYIVKILKARKVRCVGYHAGLTTKVKARVQSQYETGEAKVIVATTAFGMGIDKADVRYVLNHSLPGSVEAYFQESGRAGRDGKPSESIVYFARRDAETRRYFASLPPKSGSKGNPGQVERQLQAIESMISYCTVVSCRRTTLLAHFGELASSADVCGPHGCDVCCNERDVKVRMRAVFSRRSNAWGARGSGGFSGPARISPAAEFQSARTLERVAARDEAESIDLTTPEKSKTPLEAMRKTLPLSGEDVEASSMPMRSLVDLAREEDEELQMNPGRGSVKNRLKQKLGAAGTVRMPTTGFQSARSLIPAGSTSGKPVRRLGPRGTLASASKGLVNDASPSSRAAPVDSGLAGNFAPPVSKNRSTKRLKTPSRNQAEDDVSSFSSDTSHRPKKQKRQGTLSRFGGLSEP